MQKKADGKADYARLYSEGSAHLSQNLQKAVHQALWALMEKDHSLG